MVERQPSKLHTRVRFPLPAPFIIKHLQGSASEVQVKHPQKLIFSSKDAATNNNFHRKTNLLDPGSFWDDQ
jgi:hypothetical protein